MKLCQQLLASHDCACARRRGGFIVISVGHSHLTVPTGAECLPMLFLIDCTYQLQPDLFNDVKQGSMC